LIETPTRLRGSEWFGPKQSDLSVPDAPVGMSFLEFASS
jgi:hypothetical protein